MALSPDSFSFSWTLLARSSWRSVLSATFFFLVVVVVAGALRSFHFFGLFYFVRLILRLRWFKSAVARSDRHVLYISQDKTG